MLGVGVLGLLGLTACGSDADPVTQVSAGIEQIEVASGAACDAERRTLETAVEAFELLEGAPPADEAAMVPDWLREPSELFDVIDGEIVPGDGSPCT